MENFFSEIGISALDFVQISTVYCLTMLIFFALRDKRHRWLRYSSLSGFILQCVLFILFHDGLPVKIFSALMLISALLVQAIVTKRRKSEAAESHN